MSKALAQVIKKSVIGLLCIKLVYNFVVGSGLLDAITNIESRISNVINMSGF